MRPSSMIGGKVIWLAANASKAIEPVPMTDGFAVQGYCAETLGDYAQQGIALLRPACPERKEMRLLIDGVPSDPAGEETFALGGCGVDLPAAVDDE